MERKKLFHKDDKAIKERKKDGMRTLLCSASVKMTLNLKQSVKIVVVNLKT